MRVIARRMPQPAIWDEFFRPGLWNEVSRFDIAADVYETSNSVVVEMAVPGLKPEELSITVTGDILTVSGESKRQEEVEEREYLRQEVRYGKFSQSILLPSGVQSDRAEANFEHGILKISLPKAEEAKPKKIEIKK